MCYMLVSELMDTIHVLFYRDVNSGYDSLMTFVLSCSYRLLFLQTEQHT